MAEPGFWAAYLFEDEDDDYEGDSLRAEFGLGEGLVLVLELDSSFWLFELGLLAPGLEEPAELGFDDQAHFHPHVMRWAELDLLARASALHDPEIRHPGPALGLLARFAFVDEDTDLDTISPLLDAAFSLVRPLDGAGLRPETRDWFELRDLRGTGLRWTVEESGHPALESTDEGELPLYSLRTPDSEGFPFAEWAALLARAERIVNASAATDEPAVRAALDRCAAADGYEHLAPLAEALLGAGFSQQVLLRALTDPVSRAESCWAVEVLAGLPQGSLVKLWFGESPLATARSWDLNLTLRPDTTFALTTDLAEALREAGLGKAEIASSSGHEGADGRYITDSASLSVLVRDDLAAGVALVAGVLRRHDMVHLAELRHAGPSGDPIPL